MKVDLKDGERIDDLERSNLCIIQDPKRFCFGMDAVLLSGFVHTKPGAKVLDLGTGTGIIPILLSAKTEASHISALEIQEDSAEMAKRSVLLNDLQDKIEIVNGDIKAADEIFTKASFDAVTCNPPYMIGEHGLKNPDSAMAIARHEVMCTFDDVARAAASLLKPGGNFFLVHRPFRLAELFSTLQKYKLEPKRMQLVYPFVDKEPNMVLIEASRGGKSRMEVLRPLIIYKQPGVYTEDVLEIYGY